MTTSANTNNAGGRKLAAPPRLATALLAGVLPVELRDDVLGDLQEGFLARISEAGGGTARRWYWRQALQGVRHARGGKTPDPLPGRRTSKLRSAFMGFIKYDITYALRQLRSNPGFTAVAVLSLALGIGVNSTVFTFVNSVFLQPLPVRDIDEVVEVFSTTPGSEFNFSSYPDYEDYRAEVDAFSGLAGEMTMLYSWNRDTHSESLFGSLVSDNYFDVLGVEPFRGRWFSPEENRTPGTHPVAVLSHDFWQRNLEADPSVIGSTLRLNGTIFTVVGVAPEAFTGTIPLIQPDLFTPLMSEPLVNPFGGGGAMVTRRGSRSVRVFGRLSEGADIELARAQLDTVAARLATEYPDTNEDRGANLTPLSQVRINPAADRMMAPVAGFLLGLVGLVLLVACANVANMLLARASARSREIGVRLALGAGRWRLIRQLLTESVILSLIGGAAAAVITVWVSRLITSLQPPLAMELVVDVAPDGRVFLFTFFAAVVTGITFGLVPALRSSKPDLVATLKDDTAGGGSLKLFSLRNALVITQVAVSMVLLVTAGLFARSLGNASSVDLGFNEKNVAFVSASLKAAGYENDEALRFLRDVADRVENMPGVRAATYTARLPMNLTNASERFEIEGYTPENGEYTSIEFNTVGPEYFSILEIPIVRGRPIHITDDPGSPLVAVVNQEFVDRYWPGQSGLGNRIRTDGNNDVWAEVVGISGNYKMSSVGEEDAPLVHMSMNQQKAFFFMETLMVRTEGEPGPMVATLREEITALNPDIAFFDARTLEENLSSVLFPVRMGAAMLGVFGVLALGLAAVGVYGVIAYSVSRRTHEIGIRMALGAAAGDVRGMVVRQGMTIVLIGVTIGAGLAALLAMGLGGLLYDVSPIDPVAFAVTTAVLIGVAFLANYIPARRGARVDPLVALRSE